MAVRPSEVPGGARGECELGAEIERGLLSKLSIENPLRPSGVEGPHLATCGLRAQVCLVLHS